MRISVILLLAGFFAACSSSDAGRKLPASGVSVPVDSVVAADTLTIAMTGDIMMGTTFPDVALPADGGRGLFADAGGVLAGADIALGNLEGTLCDTVHTEKVVSEVSYAFRTPTAFAANLKAAGYDFMSMANNHAFDFGIEGVRSTERCLEELGIEYAGIRGRRELAVVERNGVRYGVCAFGHNGYTLRHQDLGLAKRIIDSLRVVADIVVVSFHGGAEGCGSRHLPYGKEEFLNEDRGALREFAHFCIDNGADVVFGHGPHVVRCMEVYRGRFIAYSLGNFCTPYRISIKGVSGYAPVVTVRVDRAGRFIDGRIHSFVQRYGIGPRRDSANAVVGEIRALTDADIEDSRICISDEGRIVLR